MQVDISNDVFLKSSHWLITLGSCHNYPRHEERIEEKRIQQDIHTASCRRLDYSFKANIISSALRIISSPYTPSFSSLTFLAPSISRVRACP
jgi:hypothetical protein